MDSPISFESCQSPNRVTGTKRKSLFYLKICGIVTISFAVTITLILVILYFTLFKPKQPVITTYPVTLESWKLVVFPVQMLNVTLGITVTVDNRNYGSLKYEASEASLNYSGVVIGEGPIEADRIPPRAKHNVSTSVTIYGDKLIGDGDFLGKLLGGSMLNFTSSTTLHGEAAVLKLFKIKATSVSTCNITLFLQDQRTESFCQTLLTF